MHPANLRLLSFPRGGPERVDDLGEPALLDVLWHVVIQVTRRGGPVALRVGEHERLLVPNLLHQAHRVLVVLLSFAAETRDDVGGDGAAGDDILDPIDEGEVRLPGVAAGHALEVGGGAALRGHVQAVAHVGSPGDHLEDLVGEILGVGRGEPDAHLGVDRRDAVEQRGELQRTLAPSLGLVAGGETRGVPRERGSTRRRRRRNLRAHALLLARLFAHHALAVREHGEEVSLTLTRGAAVRVGVDVLSQQRHLLDALLGQQADLVLDGRRVPGSFPAARVGYDAESACVVATAHDGHERRVSSLLAHGDDIGVGLLHGQLNVHGLLAGARDRLDEVGEVSVRVRARDEVRELVSLQQLGLEPLGHAAEDANHGLLRFLLLPAKRLEVREPLPDLGLGLVPDGAGVDEDDIGIVHFRGLVVSAVLEDREHHLAVVDVHLAPVGLHVHVLATLVGDVVAVEERARDALGGLAGGDGFVRVEMNATAGSVRADLQAGARRGGPPRGNGADTRCARHAAAEGEGRGRRHVRVVSKVVEASRLVVRLVVDVHLAPVGLHVHVLATLVGDVVAVEERARDALGGLAGGDGFVRVEMNATAGSVRADLQAGARRGGPPRGNGADTRCARHAAAEGEGRGRRHVRVVSKVVEASRLLVRLVKRVLGVRSRPSDVGGGSLREFCFIVSGGTQGGTYRQTG